MNCFDKIVNLFRQFNVFRFYLIIIFNKQLVATIMFDGVVYFNFIHICIHFNWYNGINDTMLISTPLPFSVDTDTCQLIKCLIIYLYPTNAKELNRLHAVIIYVVIVYRNLKCWMNNRIFDVFRKKWDRDLIYLRRS